MMSYSFSKREKALLVILAVVLIGIVWYMLVFQRSASEISRLNGEISETDNAITLANARVAQMNQMQRDIQDLKAQGARQVEMPSFDNLQPLMAELNSVMSMTDTYSMSFDQLGDPSGGYVMRGVTITYSSSSYDAAEAVIDALAYGTYPCSIDSVSIVDGASSTSRGSSSSASATIHVTFFERA